MRFFNTAGLCRHDIHYMLPVAGLTLVNIRQGFRLLSCQAKSKRRTA